MKERIKKVCIRYCKRKTWEEKQEERELFEIIQTEQKKMEKDPKQDITALSVAQSKLHNLTVNKCKAAAIREKAEYLIEGKKSTAYFLGMEKQKQQWAYIKGIINKEGKKL